MSAARTRARSQRQLLFGRYEWLELLGRGGFGEVVRSLDTETGGIVALKILSRVSPDALLSFKREFRALSDVYHPHVVRLGELVESEGAWGFSMEYVPGTDFTSWVRDTRHASGYDEGRLRRGVAQLARGLVGLHRIGLLHRDIKPHNVRVTPSGRAVLLDFGLVMHLSSGRVADPGAGTAAYMAPEQWDTAGMCEATDFYGLGGLLYEALTGKPPFVGSSIEIMVQKDQGEPVPPRAACPWIPADLNQLCCALLARDPSARPDGPAVLSALGAKGPSKPPRPVADTPRSGELFVGRTAEMALLSDCFARARQASLELVLIEGESGLGKSALVRELARRLLEDEPDLVYLEGRCHEAEQVPYKMFDALFDDVARYLSGLSGAECASLLPADVELLPSLFPVLGTVEAIRMRADSRRVSSEHIERFTVFRSATALFAAVAEHHPLLLFVDDVHFADAESLSLLRAMLNAPSPPSALLLATVRRLDTLEGPVADALRALSRHARVRRLRLDPLTASESEELSARCLGVADDHPRVGEIAAEARGHPLFIAELAKRRARSQGAVSLDEVLLERTALLDGEERLSLELLAVAGVPTSILTLARAAGLPTEAVERAAQALRTKRLSRAARRGELSYYHDRIRQAILGTLGPDQRAAHHARLARAYTQSKERDASVIAHHLLGAGETKSATPWLERAATEAMAKAAFEKAAELYRTLLTRCSSTLTASQTHALQIALAEALSGAGRCAESAHVLVSALETAPPGERRHMRVRAAQRMLQAGDVAAGLAAAELALREVGLSWPSTSVGVSARLAWHRTRVSLHGLHVELSDPAALNDAVEAQLDTLWRLWQPLLWADLLRGAELSARHLSLALRTRSPHATLALLGEAILIAVQHADARALEMVHESQIPDETNVEVTAYRGFARGYVKFMLWDVGGAAVDLDATEQLYRERCPSNPWMLANVRGALLAAWFNLGEQRMMAAAAERWIAESDSRADRFALASCSVLGLGALRHIMNDDPEAALREIERAMQPYSAGSIGGQHLGELSVSGSVHMYVSATAPYEYWQEAWPRFRYTFLARARFARELFDWCRADAALRAAVGGEATDRDRLLHEAQSLLARPAKSKAPVMNSLTALLQAQLFVVRGDLARAEQPAAYAHRRFLDAGHYMQHGAGLLLAHLRGPDERERARAAWASWLAAQGWTKPARAQAMGLAIYPALHD